MNTKLHVVVGLWASCRAALRRGIAKFVTSEQFATIRFVGTEFRLAVASWTAFVTNPIARGGRWLGSRLRSNSARASKQSPSIPILASASTKAAAGAPRPDLEPKPRPDLAPAPRPKPAFMPKPVFEPAPEPALEPGPAPASASAPVPLAARALSPSAVDHLLAYAIATDTRLRFFREDVIVFAGERCSLDRIPELKAARLQLADRIEDLFGVDVPGSTGDVADREARADARTARPTELESDRDWSPPQELVLAPWEVDAESIPPRRDPVVFQPSRLGRAGAQRPCPPDRDEPNDAEVRNGADADSAGRAAPARDAAARAVANPTPPLPRPRGRAPDPNVPSRQDDSTASQETPQ